MNKKVLVVVSLVVVGFLTIGVIFYLQSNRQTTNTKAAEIQPTGTGHIVETSSPRPTEAWEEVERINSIDTTSNGQVKSPLEDCASQEPQSDDVITSVRKDDNWQPPC